jgi:type VI protein secretion system component VasK
MRILPVLLLIVFILAVMFGIREVPRHDGQWTGWLLWVLMPTAGVCWCIWRLLPWPGKDGQSSDRRKP